MKSRRIPFFTLFVCLLMIIPAAIAPSHPVYIDPQTGETIDEIFGDPGSTPDSVWYGFERWWEDIQVATANTPEEKAQLLESLMQERYAEFQAMIEAGNYDVAQYTIGEIGELGDDVADIVEKAGAGGENLHLIHEIEKTAFIQENWNEILEQNLENLVAVGELPEKHAQALASTLEEGITAVQFAVENQEEEITDAIAEEQGISHLEAEFQVEEQEEESGLSEQHQEEVEEELAAVQQQLEQVEADLAQAIAEGRDVPPAATELVAEAQARLEECRNAFADGRYGESFGQFTAAEHLLDKAERFLEGEVSREEIIDLVEFTQEQRIKNHQQYVSDFERYQEQWSEKFPEHADDFENWYEQGQKAIELANALSDAYTQQAEQLRVEGRTEAEIFETLTTQFLGEYERVYGETFIPPVFDIEEDATQDINDFSSIPADTLNTDGGFVEGYMYTDPVTGYTYEFTQEGYTYITPLGLVYTEKFPDDFSFPTAYEQGNEQHSYTKETPEGTVTYNYYATGYDVTLADGTTETFAYPPGSYDLPEGGLFNYHPTGYEFRHDEEVVWYDYNVVYDTFIGEGGEVSRPPEGTYFQEDIDYSYDEQRYEFADPSGILWTYNPESHAWSSSDGQVYTPDATVIAPVGHEGEGNYQTELGETWTWDDTTNTWESNGGDIFHPESNTWQPGAATTDVNERYTFDSATGQYLDEETGEPSTNVVWSGVTWVYDGTANSWTSNTGEMYDGGLHQVPSTRNLEAGIAPYDSSKVYDFDPVLGKFIDPDTNQVTDIAWSGVTWNRDAETGEWSSDTGETRSADWTGDYNQDTSNGQSSQSWTYEPNTGTWASPGWSYDSGSGVWSSPEGGTFHDPDGNPNAWQDDSGEWHGFDESADGATYQGTPYGGGSYSSDGSGSMGGEGGWSGDGGSGGGGDSGDSGDGDGGSGSDGGAVVNSYTAKDLHPVTKWMYKYLGIKH